MADEPQFFEKAIIPSTVHATRTPRKLKALPNQTATVQYSFSDIEETGRRLAREGLWLDRPDGTTEYIPPERLRVTVDGTRGLLIEIFQEDQAKK